MLVMVCLRVMRTPRSCPGWLALLPLYSSPGSSGFSGLAASGVPFFRLRRGRSSGGRTPGGVAGPEGGGPPPATCAGLRVPLPGAALLSADFSGVPFFRVPEGLSSGGRIPGKAGPAGGGILPLHTALVSVSGVPTSGIGSTRRDSPARKPNSRLNKPGLFSSLLITLAELSTAHSQHAACKRTEA